MRIPVPSLLPLFLAGLAPLASAASIDFTFKAVSAEVSLDGAPPVKTDLTVNLLADTSHLVKGGGWFGSDRGDWL